MIQMRDICSNIISVHVQYYIYVQYKLIIITIQHWHTKTDC